MSIWVSSRLVYFTQHKIPPTNVVYIAYGLLIIIMADVWRGKNRDTPLISGKMIVSWRNNSEEFIVVQNYLPISAEISVLVSNLLFA